MFQNHSTKTHSLDITSEEKSDSPQKLCKLPSETEDEGMLTLVLLMIFVPCFVFSFRNF